MSGLGFIVVDRGVFDHPMFAPEPFTEREAWLWMLVAAAWTDKRIRIGSTMFDLSRGQMVFATRFLAQRWKWSHSRVVRYLFRLENDTMVSTRATRQATLITICNYDKYQLGRNTNETQIGTPTGTEVKHARYKEEELKNLITKEDTRVPALESDWPKDFKEQFWQLYPKRIDRTAVFKKLEQLRRGGDLPWQTLIGGVRTYAESVRGKDQQFTKGPAAWLNAGKWADEIKPSNVVTLPGGQRLEGWV